MKANPLVEAIIREACDPEVAAQILDQIDAITPEQELEAVARSHMLPEDVLKAVAEYPELTGSPNVAPSAGHPYS